MEYRVKLNLATTAVVVVLGIGVSLLTSTIVASRAYQRRGEQASRAQQTITVKGSTRRSIYSDRAVWSIQVRGEDKDLKAAYAVLEAGAAQLQAYLDRHEFAPTEVGVSAIDTSVYHQRDEKGNTTREVDGYALSRTFTVTSPDVTRVADAAANATQLIREGVLVVSMMPEYYYSDLAALKIDLMGDASADARARADAIAEHTGCRVAEVRSAHMGVLQVTRPLSTEVSDYGLYDTGTIEKDVQAVVTATFRVEPL